MKPSIRDLLSQDRSKKHLEKIADFIGEDTQLFDELMEIFLHGSYREVQMAAHVVSKCADLHPHLILPYLNQMLDLLDQPVSDAVKRNIVRVMQFIDLPEAHWDKAADRCFQLLQSRKEPIAVRVFAMSVLANLCQHLPELSQELRLIIEDELPYASAGFLSRARKILKKLPEAH